jgi:hypothetical protein
LRVHEQQRLTGSLESARDRKDRSIAELNQLKLQRARGELLQRDEVERAGRHVIATSRGKLLSLPARVIQAGAAPPSAESAIRSVVFEALRELARLSPAMTGTEHGRPREADDEKDEDEAEEARREYERRRPTKPKRGT